MTEIASLGLKVEGVNNVDKASGSLDRFSKSGDRADKSARGAAGGIKTTGVESEKSARSLTSMAGAARVAVGALAALGAYKLTSLISDVTILNSRFEQMTTVLDVVGGNAGYASDEVQKFAREVQGMGITMIESRQTVISMIQAQLDLTKASELARVAQDAAVIGNINSTEALSRLINGIKSGQVEVLRAIGINVQFEQGYKRMADQLGKSSDSLTDAERAQSRMNQVMDAGTQIAGAYEASMDSASKQLGSTTRYVEDIKVMLGEAFSIAGRDLVFGYSDALKSVNARITEMSESGELAEIAENIASGLNAIATAAPIAGTAIAAHFAGPVVASMAKATAAQVAYISQLARGNVVTLGSVIEEKQRAQATLESSAAALVAAKSLAAKTAAEVASLQAVVALTRAEVGLEQVRFKAQISAEGRRLSINRMAAASIQLSAATAALSKVEAAHAASLTGVTAASNAATAATTRLDVATKAATVSSRALTAAAGLARGALALVGGPAGAAILAAGAIYLYATRSNEAATASDVLSKSVDGLTSAKAKLAQLETETALAAEQARMKELARDIDNATSRWSEFGQGSNQNIAKQRELGEAIRLMRAQLASGVEDAAALEDRLKTLSDIIAGVASSSSSIASSADEASQGFDALMKGLEEQRILFEEGEIAAYRYSLAVKGFTPAEIDAAVAAKKHNDQLKKSIDEREKFNDSMSKWADDQRKSLESAAAAERQYAQSLADAIDPMGAFEREAEKIQEIFDKGLLGDISTSQLDAYIAKLREAAEEAAGITSGFDFASLENGLGTAVNEISKIQGAMQDGSKEAKVLADAMTVLSVAQGAAAIANAMASGDPYTAVFRALAVAAVLSQAGINSGVSGGASTAAADAQATQGTGGVLGDASAQSESISKGVDITADATSALVGINRAQLMALQSMQAGITGASTQIMRGQDFTSSEQQWGLFRNEMSGALGDSFDFITSMDGLTGWIDDMLGGSRAIINSGIEIAGGRINDLIDNTMVSAFQMVEEKKHFLDDKDTRRLSEALGDEVGGQFALVFGSMVDAVSASAEVLGFTEDQIRSRIAQFRVAATEISLMDLTGEEQNAAISAVFSDIFDSLAVSVVSYVPEFQQAGESYAETLVRIATQTQVAQEAMSQLGSILMDDLAGKAVVEMSDALIAAAGGMESFITGFTGFVDKFATDEHKLSVATTAINSAMSQLGLEVPQSEEALWDLMQTLTDPAQIAGLLRLQDSFVTMFNTSEQAARATERLAQEERDLAQARVDSAVQATNAAMNQLRASVQAQKDIVGETYNTAVAAEEARANGLIDAANAAFESRMSGMQSWADRTRNSMQGLLQITSALESAVQANIISSVAMEQAQRRGAQAVIARALATGNLSGVEDAARTLQSGPVGGSRVDRQFDAAVTANQLQDLAERTGAQASVQEQTLASLERRISQAQTNHAENIAAIEAESNGILAALETGYNAEISRLDAIIATEQERTDLMRGIDTNVYGINESLAGLDAARNEERQARMEQALLEAHQVSKEQLEEMKAMRQDWQRIKEREFEEMGAQTNIEEDQRKLLTEIQKNTAA